MLPRYRVRYSLGSFLDKTKPPKEPGVSALRDSASKQMFLTLLIILFVVDLFNFLDELFLGH